MRPLYRQMQQAYLNKFGPGVMQEAYGVNMNPYALRNSSTSEMINSPNNNGTYGPGTNATRPVNYDSNLENHINQSNFERYDIDNLSYPDNSGDIFGIPYGSEDPMLSMADTFNEIANPMDTAYIKDSRKRKRENSQGVQGPMTPDEYESLPNTPKQNTKQYTDDFQADAKGLARAAVMRQLGITAGAGAAVGTTGLIANSAQQDSNGNLLFNPLTGAVASTMGAGAGAYAINQRVSGAPSEKSVNQWDRYEKARGTRAFDSKAQKLHNAQASRVRNRGLRAGAYTAGAVGLLNLMGQLGDQQ